MIAVMLLDETVTFAAVHDEARMQGPATLSERAKVDLVHHATLDAILPEGTRSYGAGARW